MMDEGDRWTARLLEASLQSSGLSEREIEERLGWEPGRLGRILDGTAECGPLQLLEVLAEIGGDRRGNPPQHGRPERRTPMVQELLDRFRALGHGPPTIGKVGGQGPTMGEIEKTVEEVLDLTFGKNRGKREGGDG
jgi:hypothetical protein